MTDPALLQLLCDMKVFAAGDEFVFKGVATVGITPEEEGKVSTMSHVSYLPALRSMEFSEPVSESLRRRGWRGTWHCRFSQIGAWRRP